MDYPSWVVALLAPVRVGDILGTVVGSLVGIRVGNVDGAAVVSGSKSIEMDGLCVGALDVGGGTTTSEQHRTENAASVAARQPRAEESAFVEPPVTRKPVTPSHDGAKIETCNKSSDICFVGSTFVHFEISAICVQQKNNKMQILRILPHTPL